MAHDCTHITSCLNQLHYASFLPKNSHCQLCACFCHLKCPKFFLLLVFFLSPLHQLLLTMFIENDQSRSSYYKNFTSMLIVPLISTLTMRSIFSLVDDYSLVNVLHLIIFISLKPILYFFSNNKNWLAPSSSYSSLTSSPVRTSSLAQSSFDQSCVVSFQVLEFLTFMKYSLLCSVGLPSISFLLRALMTLLFSSDFNNFSLLFSPFLCYVLRIECVFFFLLLSLEI